MLCGISLAFARVSPTEGKVAHVLRTRSPRAHFLYCYRKLRVRLACVKHAASVRSEPGSNSHLKLVLVNFSRNLHSGKTEKRTVDRSVSQKKPNGFWLVLSDCQRAGTSCPAGRSTDKPQYYRCTARVSTVLFSTKAGRLKEH